MSETSKSGTHEQAEHATVESEGGKPLPFVHQVGSKHLRWSMCQWHLTYVNRPYGFVMHVVIVPPMA